MNQSTERSEAVAHLKFARMGPRKLRRVADAIRGFDLDHGTRYKGHLLRSRTPDDLSFPVQGKGLLVKLLPVTNGPGLAIHLKLVTALAHQVAAAGIVSG